MAGTRQRISLFAPGATEVTASIWAEVSVGENGGNVVLYYLYSDLKPAPGWQLECGGRRYEVREVSDRRLSVLAVQGGAA